MSKYTIAITTVNRWPRENYLLKTIENLERSGLFESKVSHEVHIFDGGSLRDDHLPHSDSRITIHTPPPCMIRERKPYGNTPVGTVTLFQNFINVCETCSSHDSEYTLLLEDDITCVDKWIDSVDLWMGRHFRHRKDRIMPVVTFFSPRRRVKKGIPYGFIREPAKSFYGRQCLLVRTSDLHSLGEFFRPHALRHGGHDQHIAKWMCKEFAPLTHMYAVAPCFVQHIGKRSSFQDRNKEIVKPKSFTFPGESWRYK